MNKRQNYETEYCVDNKRRKGNNYGGYFLYKDIGNAAVSNGKRKPERQFFVGEYFIKQTVRKFMGDNINYVRRKKTEHIENQIQTKVDFEKIYFADGEGDRYYHEPDGDGDQIENKPEFSFRVNNFILQVPFRQRIVKIHNSKTFLCNKKAHKVISLKQITLMGEYYQ